MNEAGLQKKCCEKARRQGWLAYKWSSPAHRGVPDCIFIKDGVVVFVEFKNPNGKGVLSPLQKLTCEKMVANGANVRVISSYEAFLDEVL